LFLSERFNSLAVEIQRSAIITIIRTIISTKMTKLVLVFVLLSVLMVVGINALTSGDSIQIENSIQRVQSNEDLRQQRLKNLAEAIAELKVEADEEKHTNSKAVNQMDRTLLSTASSAKTSSKIQSRSRSDEPDLYHERNCTTRVGRRAHGAGFKVGVEREDSINTLASGESEYGFPIATAHACAKKCAATTNCRQAIWSKEDTHCYLQSVHHHGYEAEHDFTSIYCPTPSEALQLSAAAHLRTSVDFATKLTLQTRRKEKEKEEKKEREKKEAEAKKHGHHSHHHHHHNSTHHHGNHTHHEHGEHHNGSHHHGNSSHSHHGHHGHHGHKHHSHRHSHEAKKQAKKLKAIAKKQRATAAALTAVQVKYDKLLEELAHKAAETKSARHTAIVDHKQSAEAIKRVSEKLKKERRKAKQQDKREKMLKDALKIRQEADRQAEKILKEAIEQAKIIRKAAKERRRKLLRKRGSKKLETKERKKKVKNITKNKEKDL